MLEEREFPLDELRLLASERSAGQTRRFRGEEIEIQAAGDDSFDGIDIAIFSAGATRSRTFAPIAVAAGAVVIDNSSAFRMEADVPLVVPEVNPHAAFTHRGVIANPNCSTMQLVPVLKPLHDAAGLEHVTVSTYQAVSGTGQKAIDALRHESATTLAGEARARRDLRPPDRVQRAAVRGRAAGRRRLHGRGAEARQRVAQDPRPARAARVGDLRARAGDQLPLGGGLGLDARAAHARPGARAARGRTGRHGRRRPGRERRTRRRSTSTASDGVYVGRIRKDLGDDHGIALWIVADNLRKGAATNTVQIAELLTGAAAPR